MGCCLVPARTYQGIDHDVIQTLGLTGRSKADALHASRGQRGPSRPSRQVQNLALITVLTVLG